MTATKKFGLDFSSATLPLTGTEATSVSQGGSLLDCTAQDIANITNVQSITTASTVTPTFSNTLVEVTALHVGLTINNPTGTAMNGWSIAFRIKDDGTSRSLTFDTQFRGIGGSLPSATTLGKWMYFAAVWNSTDSKWDVLLPATIQT